MLLASSLVRWRKRRYSVTKLPRHREVRGNDLMTVTNGVFGVESPETSHFPDQLMPLWVDIFITFKLSGTQHGKVN